LKLLRLFDEDPAFWKTKKASRAAQELLAVAFSLWRAAFLADKTGRREQVFTHGRNFLARVIEDNAIAYTQDKNAREWTFNYYTRNARYSLEFPASFWGNGFPVYKGATRNAAERWDYCQGLLDEAVDCFAELVRQRQEVRAEKAAVRKVRQEAKRRRRTVRELTAPDRERRRQRKTPLPSPREYRSRISWKSPLPTRDPP
jgi:hypothetical protein